MIIYAVLMASLKPDVLEKYYPENASSHLRETEAEKIPLEAEISGLKKLGSREFSKRLVGKNFAYATPPGAQELGGMRPLEGGGIIVGGMGLAAGAYRYVDNKLCIDLYNGREKSCIRMYISKTGVIYALPEGRDSAVAARISIHP